jgi:cardiolipin synthase
MNVELLVGAEAFWNRLKEDLESAKQRAWVQTFTFEADRAGTRLARAFERCSARDRRFLIDSYSLLYHSDRVIPGPSWFDRSLRAEVFRTHRWVRRLREGGTAVRFGNPIATRPTGLLRRSHKKVALFDDRVAYLGGINFSDHNFAWHDMMLRVESDDLTHALGLDFVGSWSGRPVAWDAEFDGLRVISASGHRNRHAFAPVVDAMRSAESSIDVVSAYVSHPFTRYLADAASRGVRVRVLTPAENNKSNLARHIIERGHRYGFEVLKYVGGMSHMKAMLIDDDLLVAGSSNFDFMSLTLLEEHIVMSRQAQLVADFKENVWMPEIARASRVSEGSSLGTRLGDMAVRAGALIAAGLATN